MNEPIWEDHHHRSSFLPNTSSVDHYLHPFFPLILSTHLKLLYCCKTQILKETYETLLKLIQLTYQKILVPLSIFMLGRTTPQMNLKPIRHFLNNSVIFFLGPMKRCWGLTHPLWSTRLKPIPQPNLLGKSKASRSMKGCSYQRQNRKTSQSRVYLSRIPDEMVSNVIVVNRKQGTIRVCIDFRDLNKACPKDNFPTPHIDQIIDNYARSVIFSFMDGFFRL